MAITAVQRTIYQTADGAEFDSEQEAKSHERTLELSHFLEESGIYWREDVDPTEVARLILEEYAVVPKRKRSTKHA